MARIKTSGVDSRNGVHLDTDTEPDSTPNAPNIFSRSSAGSSLHRALARVGGRASSRLARLQPDLGLGFSLPGGSVEARP